MLPLPGVLAVSGSQDFVTGSGSFYFRDRDQNRTRVSQIEADPYFLHTLGLELIEGEGFSPDLLASGDAALVNEGLAAQLEGQVVGVELEEADRYPGHQTRIIGVVSNFEYSSHYAASHPLIISVRPDHPIETVLVRVRPGDVSGTLAELRDAWVRLDPGVPFSYRFSMTISPSAFCGRLCLPA